MKKKKKKKKKKIVARGGNAQIAQMTMHLPYENELLTPKSLTSVSAKCGTRQK